MKSKHLFIAIATIFPFASLAQPDTNLYQTPISQNVAAWLKNLSLASGTGHISVLVPSIGGSLKCNNESVIHS